MADLQRKSYNLFDKNATDTSNGYEADHYLNSVGESGASGNHNISEYIDISGYSAITLVGDSIVGSNITNTFYNANKEKISYFYTDTSPYTTTVPNNAKYIRLTVAKSRVDKIMLISGSTPKPYEAYGAWVHSLRKLTTATEAVENPLYSDGTAITAYALKGNTTTEFTGRYIKADYIEFNWGTNGGWIDIGTPVYTDTSWYIDFAIMEAAADNWVCGASNHSIQCAELVGTQDGSSWFTGHHAVYDKAFAVGVRTRATITGDAVYKRSDPFNLYIGCANWATTEDNPTNSPPSRYRVYGLYMTRNGVLQRDMKPVYDTVTRKWGMYDYANNVFYGNAGPSGTSIAGGYYATPPSPSNPVMPNGVGERTANLIEGVISNSVINTSGVIEASQNYSTMYAPVTSGETYTFAYSASGIDVNYIYGLFATMPTSGSVTYDNSRVVVPYSTSSTITLTIPSGVSYIGIRIPNAALTTGKGIMINQGSEIATYEPWGYKIPISTLQGSAVNYLGSVQSTRPIRKIAFKGTESWVKSRNDANDYLYHIDIGANYAGAIADIISTHLPFLNRIPNADEQGCTLRTYQDNYRIIYVNFGSAIMNAQTSGNTVQGLKEYLTAQNTNGTPFTVWHTLLSPTTGTVNEPLMKIGDYADSISNAVSIPTTEGANSITVDTTVQPSEFTATWTGWHNASVQEYTALLASNPLCGIDTYKDTLNLATGACTRQIKKLVLDGTEEWRVYNSGTVYSFFYFSLPNNFRIGGMTSHYEFKDISSNNTTVGIGCTQIILRARPDNVSTTSLTDFTQWLADQYAAGTPVTVWYILETSTTETITVPSGLSGTEEGYLTQSETPTPTNPVYPTANEVDVWK